MIHLESVTKDNIDTVLALRIKESQNGFVISTAESLAKAYVYSETAFPFAVYKDDVIVGFIMMGYYELKGYYTLWEFLVDEKYQNMGYGRKALNLGIDFLKVKFDVKEVYTGVAPENAMAKHLYESVGFVFTGTIENNMEEMRLVL